MNGFSEKLKAAPLAGLWLFAAVTLLSIAAQNVIFLGLAAWVGLSLQDNPARLRPHPVLLWIVPFLALSLVASLHSENLPHSMETWRRWLLVGAAWYGAGAITDNRSLKAILGSLLFFSALWSLGASVVALAIGGGDWRAASGSGGYMVLGTGSMLLLCFFTGIVIEDRSWRRPLVFLCLAALALALFLTFTRSAWIGAAVGLGLMFLWRAPRMILVALLLGSLVLVWPHSPVRARLAQGLDMRQDSTRERVYMAQAGLGIIRDHPWLGVGDAMESFGGQLGYYRRYMPQEAKQWSSLKDNEQGHLHNNLIQIAAMYGLPALVLLLAFFGRLAGEFWRLAGASSPLARGLGLGLLAALLAWWMNGMLEYNFGSFQSGFTLWFLVGLGLAAGRIQEGRTAP